MCISQSHNRSPSSQHHPSSPSLNKPFFFFSSAHFPHQPFMRSRLFADPTLTVGMILSILSAQQNMVSSRKLLCSEYGTPKQLARLVLPRCGVKSFMLKVDFQL